MPARINARVELDGAFFRRNGLAPLHAEINKTVNELIEEKEGLKLVRAALFLGHGEKSGRYKGRVRAYRARRRGKNTRGFVGAPGTGVMSGWLERGKRSTGRGSFRGYHMFLAASRVMQSRAGPILDRHMHNATRKMSR